jgi:hypothetical protein
MKAFTISAVLLSLGAYVQAYTPGVYVTFEGAADASYSLVVPADGTTFTLGTSSNSFPSHFDSCFVLRPLSGAKPLV